MDSMYKPYKPFSMSKNQVGTGPSWFNLKYLPFWSGKTHIKKSTISSNTLQIGVTRTNQLTKVHNIIETQLKPIMTFMIQQKHHNNNLDMSGPGLAKHVYEKGIILMLASTKFQVTSFLWIQKTQPAKT